MPQRFLRPGLTTSLRFNGVSWPAQTLFTRLITLVDDFGRYDADPRLLKSHAFPFGDPAGKDIGIKNIETWCKELEVAELCSFYIGDDAKKYLQISKWQERSRSEKSRYPALTEKSCRFLRNPAESCGILPPKSSPSPSSPPLAIASGAIGLQKPSRGNTEVDDVEWKKGLMSDLAYRHINIPVEFSKWQRWCSRKKKKPTQARFESWLNNIEAPVVSFNGARTIKPPKVLPPLRPELTEEQIERNKAFMGPLMDGLRKKLSGAA